MRGSDGLLVTLLCSVFQSGKTGSFLSPSSFIVKDLEQEKKFNFCLEESLKVASSQPLLQVPRGRPLVHSVTGRMWQRCNRLLMMTTNHPDTRKRFFF